MFPVLHLILLCKTVNWFKAPLRWDFSQYASFDQWTVWWGEQGLQGRNTNFWKVFHDHHICHVEAHSWRLTHHNGHKLKKSWDKHFFFQNLWIEKKISKVKKKTTPKKNNSIFNHMSLKSCSTLKKSWSPLMRIMVVNSSRRTMMVHLLKLYWSISLGLKWEVRLESLPKWKQLSAADSSWVASSVKKKWTAFRKLESSAEPEEWRKKILVNSM